MKLLLISLIMQFYGMNGLQSGTPISGYSVLDSIYNPALFASSQKWKIHVLTEFTYANDYERQSEFVYDQFNNAVGEFTTYSNSHGYIKPTNLTLSLSRKRINIVAGYELLSSLEYVFDQYVRSNDYSRLYHNYLISDGAIYSYFAGFGLKGNHVSLGLKICRVVSSTDVNTNMYYILSPGENRSIVKKTYSLWGSVDLSPRIHLSFSFSPDVTFESISHFVVGLLDVCTYLPDRTELGISYTPPSDIVSEVQFIGGNRDDYPFYKINFVHNFLGIYPFEIGGGLQKIDEDVWDSNFHLGTGLIKNNLKMSVGINYHYTEVTTGIHKNYYTETLVNLRLVYSK